MYNKKIKCWESGQYDEAVIQWAAESFNCDNPQAMFIQADLLLAQASSGKQTADAVYLMEKAAKMEYPQAAYAMGQMFQYGWAVQRSPKTARTWYEKAAALGSPEAAAILKAMRRQQQLRAAAAAAVVCVIVAAALLLPSLLPVNGILVGEHTELVQPTTREEFVLALNDLIGRYDNELVITGQQSTNRLLLKFEGSGIDLSDFPAATVIADQDNYLVIQFTSEEEARQCLEALRQMDGILFASEDSYHSSISDTAPSDAYRSTAVPYSSPYTGFNYFSWGAEYMGMDRLAAWIMTLQTAPATVAVIDTGVDPCDENEHMILEGVDLVYPEYPYGWTDVCDHGTHVAGIIIDCTWGLDVSILPIQVFHREGYASDSAIVEGIRYAIDQSVEVINMSLGGPCDVSGEHDDCGGPTDYYVREAVANGIVVVVAAGNGDGNGNPVDTAGECPAHIGEAITVAACDSSGQLGYFSNYGEAVDVCAPGVDVLSYVMEDAKGWKNGTSMAAPHIAALAVMLKMHLPDSTPAQIEKYITDYCFNAGDPLYYGEGIPWAGYFAGD